MRVALVGDAFTDRYVFGNVERISPEAPVPILDVESVEERPGGVLNVAANLLALGIEPTVFTISDYKLNCKIVSPLPCTSLKKTRLMASDHQLLRVDNPKVYYEEDLSRMEYPSFEDFDIIAFVDYNKGVINGGVATIVDSKKNDLSVFKDTEYLKINQKEFSKALNTTGFKYSFITKGEDGIDYYKNGVLDSSCGTKAKKIVDSLCLEL